MIKWYCDACEDDFCEVEQEYEDAPIACPRYKGNGNPEWKRMEEARGE